MGQLRYVGSLLVGKKPPCVGASVIEVVGPTMRCGLGGFLPVLRVVSWLGGVLAGWWLS